MFLIRVTGAGAPTLNQFPSSECTGTGRSGVDATAPRWSPPTPPSIAFKITGAGVISCEMEDLNMQGVWKHCLTPALLCTPLNYIMTNGKCKCCGNQDRETWCAPCGSYHLKLCWFTHSEILNQKIMTSMKCRKCLLLLWQRDLK